MRPLLLALLANSLACGSTTLCPPPAATFSVRVTVLDAASGSRICDATVTIMGSSGFKETAVAYGDAGSCDYAGALERADSYRVHVERATLIAAEGEGTATALTGCPGVVSATTVVVQLKHP